MGWVRSWVGGVNGQRGAVNGTCADVNGTCEWDLCESPLGLWDSGRGPRKSHRVARMHAVPYDRMVGVVRYGRYGRYGRRGPAQKAERTVGTLVLLGYRPSKFDSIQHRQQLLISLSHVKKTDNKADMLHVARTAANGRHARPYYFTVLNVANRYKRSLALIPRP